MHWASASEHALTTDLLKLLFSIAVVPCHVCLSKSPCKQAKAPSNDMNCLMDTIPNWFDEKSYHTSRKLNVCWPMMQLPGNVEPLIPKLSPMQLKTPSTQNRPARLMPSSPHSRVSSGFPPSESSYKQHLQAMLLHINLSNSHLVEFQPPAGQN